MGTSRFFQVAFIVGSLFMILLIILYWDDVGALNLYPHDPHDLSHHHPHPAAALSPSLSPSSSHALPQPHSLLWGLGSLGGFLSLSSSSSAPRERGPTILTPQPHSPPKNPTTGLILDEKDGTPKEEGKPPIEGDPLDLSVKQEENGRGEEESGKEEEKKKREEGRRQEERRKRIQDVCSGNGTLEFPGRDRTFDQIPNRELDHLIVDDRHEVIYCYVPKVACTNWKRVMVVLSEGLLSEDGQPYRDPQAVPPDLIHNSSLHLTFSKFWRRYGRLSRHLMRVKLQSYTKFLFVRDPFVRLISAFRNKFGQPNEDFYKQFGSVMLRRFGNVSSLPNSVAEAFKAGIRPSFPEFVQYLLDPETEKEIPFNEHWRQVYRLCHPCQIQYDFVGKLENLDEDSDHLLRLLEVDDQIRFPPSNRNRTATSWERDWFTDVPPELRRKLYNLYKPDFELFGYPRPEMLLHL